ncbi:hypothetical protein JTB14_006473 [Gonioctena quinquepunctata]|nr:hypothetical protein JTB14_006473 [Gonioctena quinquepunctata]
MFIYPRRTLNGFSLPSWLTSSGPVSMKKQVCESKYDPFVEEEELMESNEGYARWKVSIRHLAPYHERRTAKGNGTAMDNIEMDHQNTDNVDTVASSPDSKVSDVDGQPYTTILYGNGPGFANPRIVPLNTTSAAEDRNQVHGSAVPRQWATHGGEDVPVYALGPLATTLFTGTFDQSYIPHAIAYSACLGEHRLRCQGLDNYTVAHPANCASSEVSSVSAAGQPIVIASSVRADDSQRAKSSSNSLSSTLFILPVIVMYITNFRMN